MTPQVRAIASEVQDLFEAKIVGNLKGTIVHDGVDKQEEKEGDGAGLRGVGGSSEAEPKKRSSCVTSLDTDNISDSASTGSTSPPHLLNLPLSSSPSPSSTPTSSPSSSKASHDTSVPISTIEQDMEIKFMAREKILREQYETREAKLRREWEETRAVQDFVETMQTDGKVTQLETENKELRTQLQEKTAEYQAFQEATYWDRRELQKRRMSGNLRNQFEKAVRTSARVGETTPMWEAVQTLLRMLRDPTVVDRNSPRFEEWYWGLRQHLDTIATTHGKTIDHVSTLYGRLSHPLHGKTEYKDHNLDYADYYLISGLIWWTGATPEEWDFQAVW
ncbi:hypothetical protein HDV00_004583 [Rhizophlyctis rosea]|nr:hypothetical protein HDV00_004583 [Rhizophlyctis rosea]